MTGTRIRPRWTALALLLVLGGCSGPRYYEDIPEPDTQPAPAQTLSGEEWMVKSGDTLYSIAFALGLDWRDIAASNAIAPPYTIYPGQRLRVGRMAMQRALDPVDPASPRETAAGDETPVPQVPVASRIPLPEPGPASTAPVDNQPTAATAPPPAPTVAMAAKPQAAAPVRRSTRTLRNGAWQWPADGVLLQRFSGGAQPHKGVDLAGAAGDPVYAVNGGTVVYAGSGVRGYGNLLIVKHDSQYLSAYAHNRRLLVEEGEVVMGGQQIAEIGDSGADRVKLHFELRRQGNPVDPLKVLPKR